MKLSMNIENVKSISHLTLDLPLEKGLYAITGENASGKSTLVACAATVFFNLAMNEYFGKPIGEASIEFRLGDAIRKWQYHDKWYQTSSGSKMQIKGFYEGSIIYGNRFRDTNFQAIHKLSTVVDSDLEQADDFIKMNLGSILKNDKHYYKDFYKLRSGLAREKYNFAGEPYFYKKGNKFIAQSFMSTGENLLTSILHSLNIRIKGRSEKSTPCLIFLDEIELALHPSSLRRMVYFLKEISNDYNMAIYFSTHSLELIRDIPPANIYYLEKYFDDSIEIINPCFPAYATRNLYSEVYGYDAVILVEDDLARGIVERILKQYKLLDNKLILTLPCGGWQNVIRMAYDIIHSNLLSKPTKVIIILDADIQQQVQPFIDKNNLTLNVPLSYLPVESLEKYLRNSLYTALDLQLYKLLSDYIFQGESLNSLILKYKRNEPYPKEDRSGKEFMKVLDDELKNLRKRREDIIEMVIKYFIENKLDKVEKLNSFLSSALSM